MTTFRRALAATTILTSIAAAGITGASAQERIVVFGDSLSDGGFFTTVDPTIPAGAGSFTTNPDPVAPEVFATGIGAPVPDIAYSPGGAPTSGGTNYAIGGARVTQANGLVPLSITQQVDAFLATGSFGGGDVAYIQGGGNDFFAFAGGGAADPTILTNAAGELAAQVGRLQAAGAPVIVTQSIQNNPADPNQQGLRDFNTAYRSALVAQVGTVSNVVFFDTETLANEILFDATRAGGATFGITNVTGLACSGVASVRCTPANYATPDANETFLLADPAHFTGAFNEIQGDAIASVVNAPTAYAGVVFGAQAMFRSQSEAMMPGRLPGSTQGTAAFAPNGGGGPVLYGGIAGHAYDGLGVDQAAGTITLGLDYMLDTGTSVGLAVAGTEGDGDIDAGGGYDLSGFSVQGHARGQADVGFASGVRWDANVQGGFVNLDDITRTFALGRSTRSQTGETEAGYLALRANAEIDLTQVDGLALGALAGLRYERVAFDNFLDRAPGVLPLSSTSVNFRTVDLDSFTTRLGVQANGQLGEANVGAYIAWEHTFGDDVTIFTRASGSPITNARNIERDADALAFGLDATFDVTEAVALTTGVSGRLGDETFVTGQIKASMRF